MLKIEISMSISPYLFCLRFYNFSDFVLKHMILDHVRLSDQDDFSMSTSLWIQSDKNQYRVLAVFQYMFLDVHILFPMRFY